MRESLGLDTDEPIPKLQRPQQGNGTLHATDSSIPASTDDATQPKRKHPPDEDTEMTTTSSTPEETQKRPKKDGAPPPQPTAGTDANEDSPAAAHARAAAAYIPFLTPEMLMPPKMPTTGEMEKVLLDLRKKALVDEYFGNEGS